MRLFGLQKAIKIARTVDGKDVPPESEPATVADAEKGLVVLAEKLMPEKQASQSAN